MPKDLAPLLSRLNRPVSTTLGITQCYNSMKWMLRSVTPFHPRHPDIDDSNQRRGTVKADTHAGHSEWQERAHFTEFRRGGEGPF